ncbi:transglutaminase-like cysteine peptidase [Photobacterium makurazakiensis]|uniref:transglutaminase-like cysteine peptidase n=1 Tax=Photobacterium makurazakiensis TaxID=2910234 RepID=UPI003D12FE17
MLCLLTLLSTSAKVNALTQSELDSIALIRASYGERAGLRVTAWRQLLADIRHSDERLLLEQVNDFFNQLRFLDDIDIWGKDDYWATPLEFLGVGAGDCEEFSIAKYFSLRELGMDDEKLRLIYVKAIELNQFHMVLAYYPTPSSIPLLLDNLTPEIVDASQRQDLHPIFSFNGSKLWLIKLQGKGELAGDAGQIKQWNDLRRRFSSQQLAQPIVNFDE